MNTSEEIREQMRKWDATGNEHDFYEINLATKLEKALKIEDFLDNHLSNLKAVVKEVVEFNTNSWKITTNNNRVYRYYSTSGKIKECKKNSKIFRVPYKGVVKFFSKKDFQLNRW